MSFKLRGSLHWLISGLLIVSLSACSGGIQTNYSELELKEITGIVSLDDEVVEGAVVIFEGEDLTYSYGTTDSSGFYRLQFNSEQTGIMDGPKTVRIGTTLSTGEVDWSSEGGEEEGGDPDAESSGEEIPSCYNSDSQIQVTIVASATMNFDLKSDCSTTGPSE